MSKPVLQTRRIGLRPHFSGHPLAPMEIVYTVEKPPGFLARLTALSPQKKLWLAISLGSIGFLSYILVRAIADILRDGFPPFFGPAFGVIASLYLALFLFRR